MPTSRFWRRCFLQLRLTEIAQINISSTDECLGYGSAVYGDVGRWQQRRKVSAELFFGWDLSSFSDNGIGLMWLYSIWFCTQRQGRSIGGSNLSCGGFGQLEGGREDGLVLLSHNFGRPLLGGFSGNSGFLSGGSRSGFVINIEGSPMEV